MKTYPTVPALLRRFTFFAHGHPALVLALLLAAPLAQAQVVSNTEDSGAGSLRAVVAAAAPGATITFAPELSGQTIALTTGAIPLSKNVTLDGSVLPNGIQIRNDKKPSRILVVPAGVTANLKRLRLSGGTSDVDVHPGGGGAVLNEGTLTLTGCTLDQNEALGGGAIYNHQGTLSLNQCTFEGNEVYNKGARGGAAHNYYGTLTINQCTFTGNSNFAENGSGSAIYSSGGSLTINQSTITANRGKADYADAAAVEVRESTATVFNSIVAGNDINIYGSYTEKGINLLNGDPLLLPLGDYGGPTQTMPPRPHSPAVDAGSDFIGTGVFGIPIGTTDIFPNDQRGRSRLAGAHVDIGAVELHSNLVTNLADAGPGSLRQVASAPEAGSAITFAANLSGGSIQLESQLLLSDSCTIDASALPGGIQLLGSYRVLQVAANATVALRALTLRNGFDTDRGGGIFNQGDLTLDRCTIAENGNGGEIVTAAGGGIYNAGQLTLNQCTVAGNRAGSGAGIRNQSGASLVVNQCTIVGNESAFASGGIFSHGSLTLFNSIVAGNQGGGEYDPDPDVHGVSLAATGKNLIGGDPGLAGLGHHGGPTPTMPPLSGSPAVDAAASSALDLFTIDQRGGWRRSGAGVDIGAVEFQGPGLVLNAAYWRMGEHDLGAVNGAATINTTDALGGALALLPDARYTNVVAATAASSIGSTLGLHFDSGRHGTRALFALTDNFGLELWVRPDATATTQCLAHNGASDSSGWGIYLVGGRYQALLGGVVLFGDAPAVAGTWTHLALVRDNGVNVFYVDGVPNATDTSAPISPSGRFAVAVQPQTLSGESFAGSLDEVRVFSFSPGAFSTGELLYRRTSAAPTDLALTSTSVAENQPAATVVGTLSGTDPNPGQSATLTFSLVTGPGDTDNARFAIVGIELRTAEGFDFETQSSRSIRLRATDADGLSHEEALTITVTDVNDPPVAGADTLARPATTRVVKVLKSALLANDTDADLDPLTITAVGDPLPAGATVVISGNFVVYAAPANDAGNGSFTYTLNDGPGGHTVTGTVTVTGTTVLPDSPPNAASVAVVGADVELGFLGLPGRIYRLQYTTDLTPPFTWQEFAPPVELVAPASGVLTHTDVAPAGPSRFYRAVLRP